MQRILVSSLIAVLIHGGLVFYNPFWKASPKKVSENDRAITISISHVRIREKIPVPPPKPPEKKKENPVPPRKPISKKEIVKKTKIPVKKAALPEKKKESPIIPEEPETVFEEMGEEKEVEPVKEPELPTSPPAEEKKVPPDLPVPAKSAGIQKEAIPVYKNNPLPRYPRKAKRLGHSGTVQLMVLVDEKGMVKNIWIFESSGYASLDQEAEKTVRAWLFEPGELDGKPEEMWVKIPVTFKINRD